MTEAIPHTSYQTPTRSLLERAFFSQESVLKVVVNNKNECYFQWGWKAQGKWDWKNVKFNDAELGEILLVLEGGKDKVSFFHNFETRKGKTITQIWINRSNSYCTFKVKECSKGLNTGEQKVLEVLLKHAIVMMNLE